MRYAQSALAWSARQAMLMLDRMRLFSFKLVS